MSDSEVSALRGLTDRQSKNKARLVAHLLTVLLGIALIISTLFIHPCHNIMSSEHTIMRASVAPSARSRLPMSSVPSTANSAMSSVLSAPKSGKVRHELSSEQSTPCNAEIVDTKRCCPHTRPLLLSPVVQSTFQDLDIICPGPLVWCNSREMNITSSFPCSFRTPTSDLRFNPICNTSVAPF